MRNQVLTLPHRTVWLNGFAIMFLATFSLTSRAQVSNLSVRAMAANISSGNYQSYETAGINIFQGLKPDIVAIQEFRAFTGSSGTTNDLNIRALVDTAFGTNFYYYKEFDTGYSIPNGIVSRWPIVASGTWDDTVIPDRGFAWAKIDLPGTNDLYVVSLHLYNGGTETDRNNEAIAVKSNILANFPTNSWIIVGGDFNTSSRSEAAITTFKTFLSDAPIPTDNYAGGDPDTNESRNKPYDYLLPSQNLTNYLVPVTFPSRSYPNGLVFDSSVFATNATLADVWPVTVNDSHVNGMQHMAVIKNFLLPVFGTNGSPTAPSIVTQPQSQTNTVGAPAQFVVTADGTAPLVYQWQFNDTNISGATTTNYSIASVQTSNAGNYSVIITNSEGKATSDVATLTVLLTNTPPTITTNPISQTNVTGSTVNFFVTATGTTPLSYQWRFNGTNISTTATNSTFAIISAQTNDSGPYTVVVTNIAGALASSVATLTITPASTNNYTGVLAGWDVRGVTNFGTSPLLPTTNAPGIAVIGLTRGTGLTTVPSAAARAWGANGWDIASASAAAIAANDFVTLGIEASPDNLVSFNSVSRLDYRRSGTGPTNGVLQYQLGSGTFTNITNFAYTVNTSGGASLPAIDLSGIAELQNVGPGTNVTFRVVNFGSTSSSGTWYIFDVANNTDDDFAISGTVTPIAPPAAPPAVGPTLSTPSIVGNQLTLHLTGTPTSNYVVEASNNLMLSNWISLQTNAAPFWFTNTITVPQQFYRGVVAP